MPWTRVLTQPFFVLLAVDTAVDGSRAGRLVLQAVRSFGGSPSDAGSPGTPSGRSGPPTTPGASTSAEPPRTLLRGILSQQPAASGGSAHNSAAVLSLVNLHSILQPGHPALRPAGPSDPSYHASQHPFVKPGK